MLAGDEDDAFRLGLAREAARAIYRDPSAPVPYEPRGASECREAVTALSECFLAAGGTVAQIVANARAAAQVLSDDHLQGVSESFRMLTTRAQRSSASTKQQIGSLPCTTARR